MDPILKVSVEAAGGLGAREILQTGLRRLGNTDQSVSVEISEKGEFLVGAIGEVHLENTIRNLKETFCGGKIDIQFGEAVVGYGETCLGGGGGEGWMKRKQTPLGQLLNPIFKKEVILFCEVSDSFGRNCEARSAECVA